MESVVLVDLQNSQVSEVKEKSTETEKSINALVEISVDIKEINLSENKPIDDKKVEKPVDKNEPIYKLIKEILLSNEKIQELLYKSKIELNPNELKKFITVLNYLFDQTRLNQFGQIITALESVLSDGKLELHEIPELVSTIYLNISSINIKLSSNDIGVLLKVIIYILIETNVVKINTQDFELISTVIDSSLKLLQLFVKIPVLKHCLCIF